VVLSPAMSNDAGHDASAQAKTNAGDASHELGNADAGIADYMSNVNSQIAAGNPYESKDYLTKQNIATSGAMHSADDAADEAISSAAARTGGSSAAVAAQEAETARQGQRDLTDYNATRDTQNEDKWLQQRQQLTKDQLSGADASAGLYGTSLGANTSDLKTEEDAQAAQDAMWAGIGGSVATGAGTAIAGF
jgi:hypothetical protein